MSRELIERLRDRNTPYHRDELHREAATLLEQQAAEIERLRAEGVKLRTVMIAAAEEIHAHWDAHCDAEGYGPANLQRRLEDGIPSEYGYTAGAFAELRAEREALRKDAERYRFIRDADRSDCITPELGLYAMESLDKYVDAAMEDEANMKRAAIDAARGKA